MSKLSVRMHERLIVQQPKREELRVSGLVIRVENTSYPEAFRDLNEHRGIFYVQNLMRLCLCDVERKPEDIHVGLAQMDEAGGNEGIHKTVQLEGANTVRVQFERFVADNDELQTMTRLQLSYHPDHVVVRFRLLAHEAPKLRPRERSLFVKNDEA